VSGVALMRVAALAALAALANLMAGCGALGPEHQRPAVTLPASFAGATADGASAAPGIAANWWTLFGDAELSRRVEQALAANSDIAQAVARVQQAQAVVREADGARLPGVNAGASASRGRGLSVAPAAVSGSTRAAVSTSLEIDFWGRLQRATEAARAQLLASGYERDTVALSVASLVMQNGLAVRSLDEQIDATRQVLASRESALRVFGARLQGGVGSRLDVEQAEAQRADAALQLRDLQRQRALAESQIAWLSGQPGARLEPAPSGPEPAVPPPGLPSSLLDRRPDVRRAEQALVAATAQVGIARAAMRPTLSLTGSLGQQSRELGDLLTAGSRIWSLGFGLALPLFDGGRLAARADGAQARLAEAVAAYQAAAAAAFEVADALNNLSAARNATPDHEARTAAAEQALRLARARRDAGYSPLLELLDAERTMISARLDLLRNRQTRQQATLELIKALGGGWTADAATAGR